MSQPSDFPDPHEYGLALYEDIRHVMVAKGKVDRNALRNLYRHVSDWRFAKEWTKCRRALQAEGIILMSKGGGFYGMGDAKYVTGKALYGTKEKVLRAIDDRATFLSDAQRCDRLSETERVRINHEELLHSRFAEQAKRELSRRRKQKLPGF